MTGAIFGLAAVVLPMTEAILRMVVTINKALREIAERLDKIESRIEN